MIKKELIKSSPMGFLKLEKLTHVRDDGSIGLTRYAVTYNDTELPMVDSLIKAKILCGLIIDPSAVSLSCKVSSDGKSVVFEELEVDK